MQEVAVRHMSRAEHLLREEGCAIPIIAYTGALILGRAAFFSRQMAPEATKSFRQLAHAMLDEVLDDVELMMTQTRGRA